MYAIRLAQICRTFARFAWDMASIYAVTLKFKKEGPRVMERMQPQAHVCKSVKPSQKSRIETST